MALKLAFFGQAPFGRDVLLRLLEAGHDVVGVYTPPEGRRPDPLAVAAEERGLPLFRHRRFRSKGQAIPELVKEHRELAADLNVLAFVTVILPPEIVDGPPHASLCFHPSLLPRFRGGKPDAGVDTGPIVVQRGGVEVRDDDSAATLYFDRLYPLGVDAIVEAVTQVADGTARYTPQDEALATHQGLVDDTVARIDWTRDAMALDRLVRGCDPQPGALALHGDVPVRLFDCVRLDAAGSATPGTVVGVSEGRLLIEAVGGRLSIGKLRVGDSAKVAAAETGIEPGECLG